MNKNKSIITGVFAAAFTLCSCSDSFLEVTNPTGEPLEEYYVDDAKLNEALTSAYAPLHWPDWMVQLIMTLQLMLKSWVMTFG